jgi:hypothetical protein
MRLSKHEFFSKGVDNQKHPDIVFTFRRKANYKANKRELKRWLQYVEKRFADFKTELLTPIKQTK